MDKGKAENKRKFSFYICISLVKMGKILLPQVATGHYHSGVYSYEQDIWR